MGYRIELTPEEKKELQDVVARRLTSAKLRDLTVEYATPDGGLVLAFWRRLRGDYFDENILLSPDRIAAELNVPVSELQRLYAETMKWVQPRWKASPEYKANPPRHPSESD